MARLLLTHVRMNKGAACMRARAAKTVAGVGFACLLLAQSGCGVVPKMEQRVVLPASVEAPDAAVATASGAPAPPAPQESAPPDRLVYRSGAQGSLTTRAETDAGLSGKTIRLAFVNAPAADVARTVIGDVLGEPVSIADGVGGVVTLSVAEPIPAAEALSALESVLAESGLALLRTDNGYLLAPLQDAQGQTPRLNRPGAAIGYGVAFAPIRHAQASDIVALIAPFVSERLTMTADDARSAIILRGPQSDIASAQDAIETFDTRHLTDRTVGMFKLRYSEAAAIREEILAVLDASDGAGAAELLALPRLNMIFVTARTKAGFDEARGWIERLDQPSGGDARRLRYYPVQNTSAEILAEQIGAAFGNGYSGGYSESANSFADASPLGERRSSAPGSAVQPGFRNRSGGASSGEGVSIATDVINNALLIRATDQEYREIVDLIEHMDVQSPQVLIEATIAEVTLNDNLSYGVRWFFEDDKSRFVLSDNEAGSVGPVFPGFNYTYFGTNVRAALDALGSVTDVTVLSAPSIMVLNNQTANLQVGDEVPIVTQQAQSVVDGDAPIVSTLQLRETGVILEVKPRINASDIVVLEISQEVSDVAETTTSGIDSPTIQQRRFTSTVAVTNNGTVALGGLIREVYSDNQSGVPLLKDVPVLGYAFKSREVRKRRTELVVFLTPRIIRTDDDAKNAMRYIRREMSRLGEPIQ